MKRTPLPRRTAPMTRGRGRRKASEFNRIYGSRKRVAWIKALGCIWCDRTPCDNAHVESLGMGIKANSDRIVPLCRTCHRAYDEHRFPFDKERVRDYVKSSAARIETLWQQRTNPEHVSSVVARVMDRIA